MTAPLTPIDRDANRMGGVSFLKWLFDIRRNGAQIMAAGRLHSQVRESVIETKRQSHKIVF